MVSKFFTLSIAIAFFVILTGFKPPKSPTPQNDILYSKYGGDVDKMLREERRLDSTAHPYLYKSEEPKKEVTSTIDDESVIIEKAAIMPQFPEGEKALKEYIASGTTFYIPDTLIGKKATIIVKFYINTLGDVKSPKVIKSDNPSFDLQAIMLVDGMPKWTPAKQNGKEVNCYITLPIKFGE
ncbi:MAG TPA: energy transducer TonB [Chitinophagales bacterium]|jgi:hypothetical protein|nr:energy transducer TonB [Chitinophagales bacterium]